MIILIEAQNKFLVLLHGPAQTYRKESKINKNNVLQFKVRYETQLGLNTSNLPREKWDTWDPTLISEVWLHLFYLTIFSLEFLFHKTFVNQSKSELDFQYNGNVKSTKFCGVSTSMFQEPCFLFITIHHQSIPHSWSQTEQYFL